MPDPSEPATPPSAEDAQLSAWLRELGRQASEGRIPTLVPFLGSMLQLRGQPYHLRDHYPFAPLFNTAMPQEIVLMAARQTAKSTSISAQGVILAMLQPYFNTLFLAPRFELVRRLSSNYVRRFLAESPLRHLIIDRHSEQSVLQRTLHNQSILFFSFAGADVDRVRGLPCDKFVIDEAQDFDPRLLPVVREVVSGYQARGLRQFAGTPKTHQGLMEMRFRESSQAEWIIRCQACNYDNIPALEHDLDAMIGPFHPDISEERPGTICARCQRPIFPRTGRWIHRYPDRRLTCAGYHIPQIIMPFHFADPARWLDLLSKRAGGGGYTAAQFYNEVCAESYDVGNRLITPQELAAASVLHPNTLAAALAVVDHYQFRVAAVDWGGGGKEMTSFTTVAIMGMGPDGRIDCIYGWRSPSPHDHLGEAAELLKLLTRFRCHFLVHDYSGAGSIRETVLVASRFPAQRIFPISYIPSTRGPLMRYIPHNETTGQRDHYQLAKARSLLLTIQQIKRGYIRFFRESHETAGTHGLLQDFLSLIEERSLRSEGTEHYLIIRDETSGLPDDFAHAVNYGACALWRMSNRWPDLAVGRPLSETDLEPIVTPYRDWS